jgi:hypothetical protein
MSKKMNQFQAFVLFVTCPKCGRGNGHWCRDRAGKCVAPHRDRSQAALRASCATLTQLIPTRRS